MKVGCDDQDPGAWRHQSSRHKRSQHCTVKAKNTKQTEDIDVSS